MVVDRVKNNFKQYIGGVQSETAEEEEDVAENRSCVTNGRCWWAGVEPGGSGWIGGQLLVVVVEMTGHLTDRGHSDQHATTAP